MAASVPAGRVAASGRRLGQKRTVSRGSADGPSVDQETVRPNRLAEGRHEMCNLSAEWVLEARRRDRDTQARRQADAPLGGVVSPAGSFRAAPPRRTAMFVRFSVDLLSSLLVVVLLALIARFG